MKRIVAIFLLLSGCVFAQLSPGKLSSAHAHLEGLKNCAQCHSRKEQVSPQQCLACHTLLRQRIEAGQGLHASSAEYKDCKKCHVEHQGRAYELIYWPDGMENFDHKQTSFELKGKHKEQKCRDCHKKENIKNAADLLEKDKKLDRTFLGLSQDCLACHHDEHRGQMDKTCLNCHTMDAWKPAPKFDHDKTKFRLVGKHQQVDCSKCHTSVTDNAFAKDKSYLKFANVAHENCIDCHKDIHNNKFGRECEKCHTPNGWRPAIGAKFNHDRTSFPLTGKHQKVDCKKCHLPGKSIKIARFQNCSDCHSNAHKGQIEVAKALRCESCHNTEGYSPSLFTFADHEKTDFPLQGSHLAIPCIACHKTLSVGPAGRNVKFRFESTRCLACHNDPHQNQVNDFINKGGCESCHTVENWKKSLFDHNTTKFPLAGRHRIIECSKCHLDEKKQKWLFKNMAVDCQECHKDIHYGQFARNKDKKVKPFTDCARCHTPTDWLAEKFEHNRDARFKLDGAHAKVACASCHKKITIRKITLTLYTPMKRECRDCHGSKKFE